ncbi:hypothetical protein MNBD_GAMMA21-844 [hydrothermal vent metagenome]|uniref:CBS domain-containing protein n=1 Tax=hydrothermal vent metagenome TaxID=652676 RepID=A0A3B0ZU53_9ZZZZ
MTFYVQGLNKHEEMPLVRLFSQYRVEKTVATEPSHRPDNKQHHVDVGEQSHDDVSSKKHSGMAMQSYQAIDHIQDHGPLLLANQIMVSPVVSIRSNDSIAEAMKLFQKHHLRHIPVLAANGAVEGIVSDRDILRHLSGVTENYEQHTTLAKTRDQVKQLMRTEVLTASIDTDVRYIARLFVEQRVGAMPIVVDGNLTGIITRSDILNAVMRHFILELWA